MRIGLGLALVATVSTAVACSDSAVLEADTVALDAGAPIRTDRSVYRLRMTGDASVAEVRFEYRNGTNRTVEVPSCQGAHPPVLEKFEDGEWVVALSYPVLLCLAPPLRIGVGKTHRSTFTIRVFHRPNMYPQFEVEEIAGTYRLVWSLWHAGATEALPLEQRISNTFEVVD